MAAKLVVTKARGGTKITLVGTSGTELLSSKVFAEPRGKGATLRSLKGLLGEDIEIDDQTSAQVEKTEATVTPLRRNAAAKRTVTRRATKAPARRRSKSA